MEKTCGNCGHSIDHWTPNRCVCMRGSDSVSIYDNEREACSDWDKRTEPTLEQRYAQLVQVARELYKAIAPMHEHCCEDTCLSLGEMGWGADYCPNTFRDQLEALGVSVDG